MIKGIFFAIFAGLLWGLIFIFPLLIPEYPSILQASGRYIIFGTISLILSWYNRKYLRKLLLKDWIEAIKLVLIGHLVYFTCLTAAVQRVGAPITTVIIGLLPIVLTISTHIFCLYNKRKLFNSVVLFSLSLISIGLLCINVAELQEKNYNISIWEYISGITLAFFSVVCWTWYALRNARWLKNNPKRKPVTWANAQGIVIFPLSCLVYFAVCVYFNVIQYEFTLPFGPRPKFFIILTIIIGILCSWLGTFFWNEASQRLPTTLLGPMIVCETVTGLVYSFLYRKVWPSLLIFIGISLLIGGIVYLTRLEKKFK